MSLLCLLHIVAKVESAFVALKTRLALLQLDVTNVPACGELESPCMGLWAKAMPGCAAVKLQQAPMIAVLQLLHFSGKACKQHGADGLCYIP